MNKTFDAIKKTEQEAETIVCKAKEQATSINKELSEDIRAMECKYNKKINDLKNQLSQQETDNIEKQQARMDEAFTEETARIKSFFSDKKDEWRFALIRKVMNANGHSGN